MTRTSAQRDQRLRSVVQKNLSNRFNAGRLQFAFEHGKLLSEREDLESGIASIAKEDSEGGHE
jgi:hypothetical protein